MNVGEDHINIIELSNIQIIEVTLYYNKNCNPLY